MFHLRLKQGLSYRGVVVATKQKPDVFTEDEAISNAAVASGYFELLPSGTPIATPPAAPTGTIEAIDAMNVQQLRAYIKKKGLDIDPPKGTSADDIRAVIRMAQAAGQENGEDPTGQFAESTGGESDDGAPADGEQPSGTPVANAGE